MLADDQPAVRVEGEPVRARLGVAADVGAGVSALGAEHGDRAGRRPPVDRVGVGRAEQQRAIAGPYRAFGEREAARHSLQAGTGWHDAVKRAASRLPGDDLYRYLFAGPGTGPRVEVQGGGAHPDVV